MKKYGYFGEGLEGYMHYKLAFDRNFNSDEKDDFSTDYSYSEYEKDYLDEDFDDSDDF